MNKQPLNDLIRQSIPNADRLLSILDYVKDEIADVRKGEYSAEARLSAIEAIDTVIYNKIKSAKYNNIEGE